MNNKKQQAKAKLAKYPKEDIIEAILNQFFFESTVNMMLVDLESMRMQRAIEKEKQAFDAERAAFDDYNQWMRRMAETYGDGKSFKYGDIPYAEVEKGLKLARRLEKASDAVTKEMERTSAALGIKKKK